uniref:PiggyBac transposable element-derived protein domain-containing protein n=1 Tax=Stomoxys calcitrans TaxID=35570 RepID=A0A1I8P1N0_STOCA
MSFDDSILANIKTQQDSDEDEDCATETFMEVLDGFVCGDRSMDPLLGNEDEKSEKKEFNWMCSGGDFLKPYIDEQDIIECSKSKVPRVELRGSNGMVWSKVPPTPPIADDLPDNPSCGKGPAKNVSNPLEAWHLFIDGPMLNQLVKSTNEMIKAVRKKESHQKRLTDMTEMRAWLGLNYLCGVLRNSAHPGPTEELWTLELGNAIFRATMSYKRFEYLGECVRSVEQNDGDAYHPLDDIGDFWEKLVINCRSYYSPSDFSMIDEYILDLSMDPQSPFDHTIPACPGRRGIRFVTMCDAKTSYICNAIVASHQDPLDEEVYQLVSDIKSSRRCICLNERYSSIGLMQKLKQCQLQVVGSLANTANEIPTEIYNQLTNQQVWYSKNDTTLIGGLDPSVSPTTCLLTNGLSTRINAAKLFETVKGCNAKAYEQFRRFSTRHARSRYRYIWSLEFFYFILDISAFNSWIVYRLSEKGDADIEQRDFQRQLGLYLTQQQLKQRIHMNIKLPLPLKLQIAEVLGENVESLLSSASKVSIETSKLTGSIPNEKALIPEGITLQTRENENRKRCRGCKSRNGSKIKTRCQQCLLPYCMRHMITRCGACTGYELKQTDDLSKSEEELAGDLDASLD